MSNISLPEFLVIASFFNFSNDGEEAGDDDSDLSIGLLLPDVCRLNGPGELPFMGTFLEPQLPWLAS